MINKTITVVGLGLIGGSIAKRLKSMGEYIIGVDIDCNVIQKAIDRGVVDKGYTNPKDALAQADIIVLCIYPDAADNFVKTYYKDFKQGAILTDVVGVKTPLANLCESLSNEFTYIGGHPMAGKEVGGFDNSTEDLFIGANYILTPPNNAPEEHINDITALAKSLGAGKIVKTTPEQHDEIIGYTSQLPHIIAVAMCETPLLLKHKNFTGGSFEDVTRVAKINEILWSQLFLGNKQNILNIINGFEDSLNKIKYAIMNEDQAALKGLLMKVRKDKELIDNENNKG